MILKLKKCNLRTCFLIDNIDINKIIVSNKVPFGEKDFKYFTGYKDAKKSIILRKMSAYRRYFDKTYVFLIKDEKMLDN